MSPFGIFVVFSTILIGLDGKLKKNHPPHCTQVTKNTDYISKFKLDYPVAYIPPGQHEAYQQVSLLLAQVNLISNHMLVNGRSLGIRVPLCEDLQMPPMNYLFGVMYCVNPPAVKTAVTTVCDWAAPPQVQFTLGDDYMHVVRQDPSGRFLGNAVITTYQLCSHNITYDTQTNVPTVSAVEE